LLDPSRRLGSISKPARRFLRHLEEAAGITQRHHLMVLMVQSPPVWRRNRHDSQWWRWRAVVSLLTLQNEMFSQLAYFTESGVTRPLRRDSRVQVQLTDSSPDCCTALHLIALHCTTHDTAPLLRSIQSDCLVQRNHSWTPFRFPSDAC
jgi:hypothetical protein